MPPQALYRYCSLITSQEQPELSSQSEISPVDDEVAAKVDSILRRKYSATQEKDYDEATRLGARHLTNHANAVVIMCSSVIDSVLYTAQNTGDELIALGVITVKQTSGD